MNDMMAVARTDAIPILPHSIASMMIRRRTGWLTIASDSLVVKPTPEKAERAWNRADSCESPVSTSAVVTTRVINIEQVTTTSSVRMAIMVGRRVQGSGESSFLTPEPRPLATYLMAIMLKTMTSRATVSAMPRPIR
ncbi:MAG: hypothetical protein KA248_06810 [Kiritimatiellae bacterium]|nr:hypothetical protein [Kiritimatiellia bacterium]